MVAAECEVVRSGDWCVRMATTMYAIPSSTNHSKSATKPDTKIYDENNIWFNR